jgi:predicted ArsR family transcriptional regulator
MKLTLDPVLHQPARTAILSELLLAGIAGIEFTTLKKSLGLTDGHMSTHIKNLLEHRLIDVEKTFVHAKPKTRYRISEHGALRFKQYLDALKSMIKSLES